MSEPSHETKASELLRRAASGDTSARDELLALVYRELHRLARAEMRGERSGHTLQPTALVHEAWVRLVSEGGREPWSNRSQFSILASQAMRRVLVDHARRRRAAKRGDEPERTELDEALVQYEERSLDLLALDEALDRLARRDAELARVVELRFFGGLTSEETGRAMGLSVRQVEGAWATARGWLKRELQRQGGE